MTAFRHLAGIVGLGGLVAAFACCGGRQSCDPPEACSWPLVPGEGVSFRGPDLTPAREITTITLPPGARQGDGTWYRIDLELTFGINRERLRDLRGSPVPPGYISLAFDGDAAFQLKLSSPADASELCTGYPDGPAAVWSTLGLVSGVQRGPIACEGPTRVVFSNYLQTRSIHPGRIPVTLELQGSAIATVEEVTIEPGARLFVTEEGPPDVELRPRVSEITVSDTTTRATLDLTVTVNGRTADRASVSIIGLDASGHPERDFPAKGGPGRFTAEVAWEGRPSAVFLVSTTTGAGSDAEFIEVSAAGSSPWSTATPWLVGLFVGASLAIFVAARLRPGRRKGGVERDETIPGARP